MAAQLSFFKVRITYFQFEISLHKVQEILEIISIPWELLNVDSWVLIAVFKSHLKE